MIRAFIIFAGIVLATPVPAAEVMSAPEAAQRAQAGELLLIDIRRPEEWRETRVPGPAQPISMHHDNFFERLAHVTGGKKDARIALICARGVRSKWLSWQLERHGYTDVVDVGEGMLGSLDGPGWLARGLPLKPGP